MCFLQGLFCGSHSNLGAFNNAFCTEFTKITPSYYNVSLLSSHIVKEVSNLLQTNENLSKVVNKTILTKSCKQVVSLLPIAFVSVKPQAPNQLEFTLY